MSIIDTTSVNYALGKISGAWEKVAPTVHDIGAKYVRYVVVKEVILEAIAILACIAGWILFARSLSFIKAKWADWNKKGDEPALILLVIITGLMAVGASASVLIQGFHAVLALTNPEMYTIQSLIESAKGH